MANSYLLFAAVAFTVPGWVVSVCGLVLGYLLAAALRLPEPKRRALCIEVGMQNAGLATVLAGKHFPTMPEVAVASAVSCVWHSVSGALLAGVFNAADALAQGLARAHSSRHETAEK